jgi:hypothetical protein
MLVRYELRRLDPKLSIPGDVDSDDTFVLVASARLMKLKLDEPLETFARSNQERLLKLCELAQDDPQVRDALAWERLGMHCLYAHASMSDEANSALFTARQYIPSSTPPTESARRAIAKIIRKRLRRLHEDISDRYGFKIDVSLGDVAGLLAIWSVLFLISGYLYTSTLLRALGMDASPFLSIGDYVSASVDQIRYAGFATGWAVLIFLSGAFEGSRKSRTQIRSESVGRERTRNLAWVLVGVACVAAAWAYITFQEMFYQLARFAGILVSMAVADYIASRAFGRPLHAAALLTAVFTFAVHMATSIGEQIHSIESGKWKPTMSAKLTIRDPEDTSLEDAVVLAGAGNYVFLLNQRTKHITVLPRDRIQQVDIRMPIE